MLSFHYRMAELWTYQQTRKLSMEEQNELSMCLQANANVARKLSELHNCVDAAALVQDKPWIEELDRKITAMEQEFQLQLAAMKKSKFSKG